jgi:radical SAM superfamily enzyme YgiQ (UPF0313 family)
MRPKSPIQKVVPLGLLYLSAYLKKNCPQVHVKLIDFRLNEEKAYVELSTYLAGFKPHIIGISSLSLELVESINLAKQCQKNYADAICVLGGPASSSDYDLIEPLNVFDRIVVGEGEEIFKGIVNSTISDTSTTLHASDFPPVDVDAVDMPDYTIINLPDYFLRDNSHEAFQSFRKYVPIFTSRGCPFDCGFCFHLFGKKVRFRNIDNVCHEVEYLVRTYGIKEIHIEDDVFNLDTERVKYFFGFLEKKNIRLAVSFPNGIIYKNLDENLVNILKNGGVYRVSFGIESTSQPIMDLISKKHDVKKLEEVIRLFDKSHILTHGFLITGFPTETETDLDATIRFILASRLHTFRFAYYAPFRGTPLYKKFYHLFEKQGLNDTKNARYSASKIYSEIPEAATNARIRAASLKFYLSPSRIFRIAVAMKKKVLVRFVLRKTWLYLSKFTGKNALDNQIAENNVQH